VGDSGIKLAILPGYHAAVAIIIERVIIVGDSETASCVCLRFMVFLELSLEIELPAELVEEDASFKSAVEGIEGSGQGFNEVFRFHFQFVDCFRPAGTEYLEGVSIDKSEDYQLDIHEASGIEVLVAEFAGGLDINNGTLKV